MPIIATSLKLPSDLKARVEALAEAAGQSPHAFMVEAIERETARAELFERFVTEALEAEEELERSGPVLCGRGSFPVYDRPRGR